MSNTLKRKPPIYLLIGAIVVIIGIFVIGISMDRDTFRDANEVAWEAYLEGEWAYLIEDDIDDLIGFAPSQRYVQVLADPQFQDLRRESTYRFVEASERTTKLELLPQTENQESLFLNLTRVDDAFMTGYYDHNEAGTILEFSRRR